MNYIKTNNKEVKESGFQKIAVFSIALYIILSALFETSDFFNSQLSSASIYFCIGVCAFNILRKNVLKIDYYLTTLILIMIFFAVSSYFSPAADIYKDSYLYRFITTAILIILVYNTISDKKELSIVLNSIVIAGTALALIMYSQYGFSNLAQATERMDYAMGNHNKVALYYAYGIIFAIYLLSKNIHTWRVYPYIGCIVITTPAVMFTGSRKAILVLIISLVVLFIFRFDSKNVIKKMFAFAAVVLVIYFIIDRVPAFSVIKERFGQLFELLSGGETDNVGDKNRVDFFNISLEYFAKSPIFGNGFCYSYYLLGTYSHNNFTEILLNNGILGFILHYIPKVKVMFDGFSALKKDREYASLALIIAVSLLVCDIGVVTYYNRFLMIVLVVGVKAIELIKSESSDEK